MHNSYFAASHVKFLEAAGARTVPVNYRKGKDALIKQLQQLNGLYIPGDTYINLDNPKYMDTVRIILEWAQEANKLSTVHFPILGVSYGYLALVKAGAYRDSTLTESPLEHVVSEVQLNIRQPP